MCNRSSSYIINRICIYISFTYGIVHTRNKLSVKEVRELLCKVMSYCLYSFEGKSKDYNLRRVLCTVNHLLNKDH